MKTHTWFRVFIGAISVLVLGSAVPGTWSMSTTRLIRDDLLAECTGGQGFICEVHVLYAKCSELESCKTKTCGDFSLLDCNLEHARVRIGNDNILSCLGDESGSLYFDCDEWWDCFDSRVCAEFKSFCYVHIDDDTGVAECVVSPAGGSHVAATAPEGCIDYPWYN